MAKSKILVFDFDGTIADSWDAIFLTLNYLSPRFGHHKISSKSLTILRRKRFRDAIKELRVSKLKFPFLMRAVKRELGRRMNQVKPINGITAVLQQLHQQGYTMHIVTFNDAHNVTLFLKKYDLNFFQTITGVGLLGKKGCLRCIIKHHDCQPCDILYIGDEVRDITVAHSLEIPVVSVTWGLQPRDTLTLHAPSFVVDKPSDLLTIITP